MVSKQIIIHTDAEQDDIINDSMIREDFKEDKTQYLYKKLRISVINAKNVRSQIFQEGSVTINNRVVTVEKTEYAMFVPQSAKDAKQAGHKIIITVGDNSALYSQLAEGCKFTNYINSKTGGKQISFNDFVQAIIVNIVNSLDIMAADKELEAEEKEVFAKEEAKTVS
jgi:hypothetical protein